MESCPVFNMKSLTKWILTVIRIFMGPVPGSYQCFSALCSCFGSLGVSPEAEVKYKLQNLGIAEGVLFMMKKVQSGNHRLW